MTTIGQFYYICVRVSTWGDIFAQVEFWVDCAHQIHRHQLLEALIGRERGLLGIRLRSGRWDSSRAHRISTLEAPKSLNFTRRSATLGRQGWARRQSRLLSYATSFLVVRSVIWCLSEVGDAASDRRHPLAFNYVHASLSDCGCPIDFLVINVHLNFWYCKHSWL